MQARWVRFLYKYSCREFGDTEYSTKSDVSQEHVTKQQNHWEFSINLSLHQLISGPSAWQKCILTRSASVQFVCVYQKVFCVLVNKFILARFSIQIVQRSPISIYAERLCMLDILSAALLEIATHTTSTDYIDMQIHATAKISYSLIYLL